MDRSVNYQHGMNYDAEEFNEFFSSFGADLQLRPPRSQPLHPINAKFRSFSSSSPGIRGWNFQSDERLSIKTV
ncbi:hypothetical protein J6590_064776 [Homalodisca vitripennis]|nr:hypothetical protein J6590_064776 [Homalodisca vitripennis]